MTTTNDEMRKRVLEAAKELNRTVDQARKLRKQLEAEGVDLSDLVVYEARLSGTDSAYDALAERLQDDAHYAWAWHCNIAMAIFDTRVKISRKNANIAAATVMWRCFDVDVTAFPEYLELVGDTE